MIRILQDVRDNLLVPALGKRLEGAAWMLLTVGGTESGFARNLQVGGPARGWWQFELAGVVGVLKHPRSKDWLLDTLPVGVGAEEVWGRLAWDGPLAARVARGLLWTHPRPLPKEGDVEEAWRQYLELWRPGKPNRERFEWWAQKSLS